MASQRKKRLEPSSSPESERVRGPRNKKRNELKRASQSQFEDREELQRVAQGQSEFQELRREKYVLVDKTRYAELLSRPSSSYLLIRPRRFGKTLLLNTVMCLHQRKEELFHGTEAHTLVKDWSVHAKIPVVRFDLSSIDTTSIERFEEKLRLLVRKNAEVLGVNLSDVTDTAPNTWFEELLERCYKKHNLAKKCAVLIDEYDAPLANMLNANNGKMSHNLFEIRHALFTFLHVLKTSQHFTHSQLVTGATKFAMSDVASKMNHIIDISHSSVFSTALGFTAEEVARFFADHLDNMGSKLGLNREALLEDMVRRYGGYSFDGEQTVLNTWDVVRALNERELGNFWLSEGLTHWLSNLLTLNVAKALCPGGVIVEKITVGLDLALLEAIKRGEAVTDDKAWRALQQAGYLAVRGTKVIDEKVVLVLGPPNDFVRKDMSWKFVKAWFRGNVPEIDDVRRHVQSDNIIGVLNSIDTLCEKGTVYHHYTGRVIEAQIQGFISVLLYAANVKYVAEGCTRDGRWDVVIIGNSVDHLIECKMLNGDDEGKAQEQAKERTRAQLLRYSKALEKPYRTLRTYGAVFSRKQGKLLAALEVEL